MSSEYLFDLHERVHVLAEKRDGRVVSRSAFNGKAPRYTVELDGGGGTVAATAEGLAGCVCVDGLINPLVEIVVDPPKPSIVDEAVRLVRGNREGVYGRPAKNFETTAAMLEAWLNARPNRVVDGRVRITPLDVADMMTILKLARIGNNPTHRDSRIDIVGYQDCADMILAEST